MQTEKTILWLETHTRILLYQGTAFILRTWPYWTIRPCLDNGMQENLCLNQCNQIFIYYENIQTHIGNNKLFCYNYECTRSFDRTDRTAINGTAWNAIQTHQLFHTSYLCLQKCLIKVQFKYLSLTHHHCLPSDFHQTVDKLNHLKFWIGFTMLKDLPILFNKLKSKNYSCAFCLKKKW